REGAPAQVEVGARLGQRQPARVEAEEVGAQPGGGGHQEVRQEETAGEELASAVGHGGPLPGMVAVRPGRAVVDGEASNTGPRGASSTGAGPPSPARRSWLR